jgi:hypothetical protein
MGIYTLDQDQVNQVVSVKECSKPAVLLHVFYL